MSDKLSTKEVVKLAGLSGLWLSLDKSKREDEIDGLRKFAKIIRTEVLEEAAVVAMQALSCHEKHDIAEAIRALKGANSVANVKSEVGK